VSVKPIPDGYHTVTPYLILADPDQVIRFLERGLNAKVVGRMTLPDGSVSHADVLIGDSHVMLGGARGERKPFVSMLYLYVPDCDALYRQALAAGGQPVLPPTDMFYGDRTGAIRDPAGNEWWIATHKEDLSLEEIAKRQAASGQPKS